MSTASQEIQALTQQEYKYGFETPIEMKPFRRA